MTWSRRRSAIPSSNISAIPDDWTTFFTVSRLLGDALCYEAAVSVFVHAVLVLMDNKVGIYWRVAFLVWLTLEEVSLVQFSYVDF